MTLRCVTFDLDDTLWECGPLLNAAEEAFYAWLESNYPRISERYTPAELVENRRGYFQRFPEMAHDFTYLRRRWLHHLAESHDYDTQLAEQGFRIFWDHRKAVTRGDEAHATLQGRRQRYAVGAITKPNRAQEPTQPPSNSHSRLRKTVPVVPDMRAVSGRLGQV